MRINKLSLTNFRNYKNDTVEFSDGLNIIIGANAVGKTNLVESVYYCGLGKSPRTTKDKDLVRWGESFALIKLHVTKKYRDHLIEIHIDEQGKKRIAVDRIPITKISDLIGLLNVVYFSPDEMDIIKESPVERRRFLDISLSQQKKSYYNNLVTYNRIIAQRNKLLKMQGNPSVIKETLPVWDSQLASVGSKIIKDRYDFTAKLVSVTKECHYNLTENKEELEISYESRISDNNNLDKIKEEFLNKLQKNYEKDIYLQYTTIGSHRDDLNIKINGTDVRKFGSQGQKRTAALSLKLAEVKLFEEETGEKPILILDDVLSELDELRQSKLIEYTEKIQTLLTCVGYKGKAKKIITIENGNVKKNQ